MCYAEEGKARPPCSERPADPTPMSPTGIKTTGANDHPCVHKNFEGLELSWLSRHHRGERCRFFLGHIRAAFATAFHSNAHSARQANTGGGASVAPSPPNPTLTPRTPPFGAVRTPEPFSLGPFRTSGRCQAGTLRTLEPCPFGTARTPELCHA